MNQLQPLPIAVLISGGGTTLKNLLTHIHEFALPIDIRCVISSTAGVKGLDIAAAAGIETAVISPKAFPTPIAFRDAYFQRFRELGCKYVVMGGFLKHLLIPEDFENRVLNIHPGLIPAFCGQGMFGHHVHQAVLDYGAKISGCTVHFVDNQYDHGPIIAQRAVPVLSDDTASSLAARVFAAECDLYPAVLRLLAAGKIVISGRLVLGGEILTELSTP